METDGIVWHIKNGGLNEKNRFRCQSSQSYCSGGLGSPPVVSSFTVKAPDGSEFLFQITKLKKEED